MRIPIGLLVLGLILLVGSQLWSRDLGINRQYSDEEAVEYAESARDLHNVLHSASHANANDAHDGHSHEQTADAEVDAARERFYAARRTRDAALDGRSRISTLFRYAGIFSLVAGIVSYLLLRRRG